MVITPHAQPEWGKVIGVGVHTIICMYIHMYIGILVDKKKLDSYFSDRLTFSNIRCRASHQIYRVALPLLSVLWRARLSCGKERVWSNSILHFVLGTPRNPWHVNWLSTVSDILWGEKVGVRETTQWQPKLSTWPA